MPSTFTQLSMSVSPNAGLSKTCDHGCPLKPKMANKTYSIQQMEPKEPCALGLPQQAQAGALGRHGRVKPRPRPAGDALLARKNVGEEPLSSWVKGQKTLGTYLEPPGTTHLEPLLPTTPFKRACSWLQLSGGHDLRQKLGDGGRNWNWWVPFNLPG